MVKVTDENDNKPEFTDRLYRIHYPETPHATEDIPVFQVLSWDDDEGRNGDLTFDIRKGKDDTTIFKIHPKTGFVTATESLVNGDVHHFVVSDLTLAFMNIRKKRRKNADVLPVLAQTKHILHMACT